MNFTRIASTVALLIVGLGLAVNGYSQSFLTNGLVAYYPFNGNAHDATGNGHNGQLFGNTAPATDRFGQPSSAFWFDGTVSSITVTNAVFNIGQAGYTISGWFCSDDVTEIDQTIFNTVPHTGIVVDLNNSNRPRRLMYGIGPVTAFWTVIYAQGTKTDYSNLTWYHLAFVKSNTTYTVYVNAQVDDNRTVPAASGYDYNVGFRIGSISDTGDFGETFKGRLDDFRIYNRALSSNEVAQLYAIESGPRVNLIKAVKPSFSYLTLTTNYQMQISADLSTWTNYGAAFTATSTNMVWPQYFDVDNWNSLFFRLQITP
jgi:hypothetical protein